MWLFTTRLATESRVADAPGQNLPPHPLTRYSHSRFPVSRFPLACLVSRPASLSASAYFMLDLGNHGPITPPFVLPDR